MLAEHQGFKKVKLWIHLSLHSFQQKNCVFWRKIMQCVPRTILGDSATECRSEQQEASAGMTQKWGRHNNFWSCRSGAASSQGTHAALLRKELKEQEIMWWIIDLCGLQKWSSMVVTGIMQGLLMMICLLGWPYYLSYITKKSWKTRKNDNLSETHCGLYVCTVCSRCNVTSCNLFCSDSALGTTLQPLDVRVWEIRMGRNSNTTSS